MDLNIRKLGVTDIMPMVSIINKLDFKEIVGTLDAAKVGAKVKAAALTADEKANDDVALGFAVEMFLPVVGVILRDLPACEKPLYSWLANMCGMSEKDFRALPPAAVPEALFEIVHQESFGDFFKAASKFLG